MKIQIYNSNHKLVTIKGEKVDFYGFEKFQFVLHRKLLPNNQVSKNRWAISETISGRSVYQSCIRETKKQVTEQAQKILKINGIKGLQRAIKLALRVRTAKMKLS